MELSRIFYAVGNFNCNFIHILIPHDFYRPVVPGGAGVARAPPDFGRLINLISTMRARLCPPHNTGTPGFSDLPTSLLKI